MAFAVIALLATACEKSGKNVEQTDGLMIRATIESATKAAVTDAGKFTWTDGDEMTAYYETANTADGKVQYVLESGAGESTADFKPKTFNQVAGINRPTGFMYAAYACEVSDVNDDGTIMTITLPTTYTHAQSLKLPTPMLGMEIGEGGTVTSIPTVNFRHIAGVVKFTIHVPNNDNAETTYADFVIDCTSNKENSSNKNNSIAGVRYFDNEDFVLENRYNMSGSKKVTIEDISYTVSGNAKVATIYVPLPVGNYDCFTLKLVSNSGTIQGQVTVDNGGEGYVVEAGMLAIFEDLQVGPDFKPIQ